MVTVHPLDVVVLPENAIAEPYVSDCKTWCWFVLVVVVVVVEASCLEPFGEGVVPDGCELSD